MDLVEAFTKELRSITKCKLPISRQKISLITKSALRAVRNYKHVVQAVERFIAKCPPQYKVAGLYTVDAIVRQSLHQFCEKDVFVSRFSRQLPATIKHVAAGCTDCEVDKAALLRVLQLWMETEVFHKTLVEPLIAYVENPSQHEAEFLKAQRVANDFISSHEANKSLNRTLPGSSEDEITLKGMKMRQLSSPANPSPRVFGGGGVENLSNGKTSFLLPDVLQGTSQVKSKMANDNDLHDNGTGSIAKSNGGDAPVRSLIHSLKTLMQRAGEEKIGCAKELEALQALIVENVHRLSSEKSMRGAEMTELAQLLSQLADRANAHAQDALAKAQHQVMLSRRTRSSHNKLLDEFDYEDDEDELIPEEDRLNEQLAEEEMRSTEWFVRSLREVARNLSTAGGELLRREIHGGLSSCGSHEFGALMAAESPPPCPNYSLREPSPTKQAMGSSGSFMDNSNRSTNSATAKLFLQPMPFPIEPRYSTGLTSSPLPVATVFDYQHNHRTSNWRRDGEYDGTIDSEGSDAEDIMDDDGGVLDERTRDMKRSRSSAGGSSKKHKRHRYESPDGISKSEERRRRTREKERRRQGLPPIRTSRVGVLSRTVFIGRLPKMVDEQKVRELVEEYGTISALQFVPPRGCAFVTYQRRKHAAKTVARLHRKRLEGREVRVEWAPNKGISDNEELKAYWDESEGCAYIPESKFPIAEVESVLEGGAELDEESISESLMARIREKALASELEEKSKTEVTPEQSANTSGNSSGLLLGAPPSNPVIQPPSFITQTLPPMMGLMPNNIPLPMYPSSTPHQPPRAVNQPLLPAPPSIQPMHYSLSTPPPLLAGPVYSTPPPSYPLHLQFVRHPPVPPTHMPPRLPLLQHPGHFYSIPHPPNSLPMPPFR